MKTPELIPDWRDSWFYYSQIANAAITGISSVALAFGENPATLKIALACSVALAVLGGIGRVVQQTRRAHVQPES